MPKLKIHISVTLLGLFLAFTCMSGSLSAVIHKSLAESKRVISERPQEKHKETNEVVVQNVSFDAVVTFAQIDVSHAIYLIFEHAFYHAPQALYKEVNSCFFSDKLFETLFCFIISPNAP